MKREQLSHRIGNIEDRLVEQAENSPNFGRQRRNRGIRRIAGIAAVLVLMAGSFAIGGIALAKETFVYVEKEQEIIQIGDSGISLILPDEWAGKYGYTLNGNEVEVYQIASRETLEGAGILFSVDYLDGIYPADYIFPEPGYTVAATAANTYRLRIASDIQYDADNTAVMDEYLTLSQSISDIQILLTDWMKNNSTNAGNWEQGTVSVSFLENGEIIKTVFCDAEQSRTVREIVEAQDYTLEQGSFRYDLRITFNSGEYYMNTTTGSIENAAGYPYSAVLSVKDLSIITDMLNDL